MSAKDQPRFENGNCVVGIPVTAEISGSGLLIDQSEAEVLCAKEVRLASALAAAGLKLGLPLYVLDGHACFWVSPDANISRPPAGKPIEEQVRDIPVSAQNVTTPDIPDPATGHNETHKPDTNSVAPSPNVPLPEDVRRRLRHDIELGPDTIQVNGKDVPWSSVVHGGAVDEPPAPRKITCVVTGSERHLIPRNGSRIRPANPCDGDDIVAGEDIEIAGTDIEDVIAVDLSQGELAFDDEDD